MKSKLLFAVLALVAAAITAPTLCRANTITFETSPVGNFTGLTTENGFTYSRLSGGLFLNTTGNPGHDMEGTVTAGGGVLKIISAGSGDFNFNSLQFVAAGSTATGSQTLSVEGLLNGSPVGTDTYTKTNSTTFSTELASVLSGTTLSELDITLNAGFFGTGPNAAVFLEAIDNVVLTPLAAVPEPSSIALLATALAGFGLIRRRRKNV